MPTIRRLYLYAVSLVSLEVVLWGVINLARSIAAGREIGGAVSSLAGALSFILVGVPVFLLHWWLAQRGTLAGTAAGGGQRQVEERYARLRAVFLYGVLAGTLVPVVQNTLALLDRSLLALFGRSPVSAMFGGGQTFADNLIAVVFNLVAAAYFFQVLRQDWKGAVVEDGSPPARPDDDWAEVRRLYRYLWLLYALVMVVFGVQQLLRYLLGLGTALGAAPLASLANGLALLLVGVPLWVWLAQRQQSFLAEPAEAFSLIRLVVLYLLSLVSVSGMLDLGGIGVLPDPAGPAGRAALPAGFPGTDQQSALAPAAVGRGVGLLRPRPDTAR